MTDVLTRVKRANKLFLGLIIFYIGGALALGASGVMEQVPQNWSVVIGQLLAALPAAVYCLFCRELPFGPAYRERLPVSAGVLLAVLGVAVMPMMIFVNLLSQLFVPNEIAGVIFDMQENPLWLNIVLVALIPSVMEETIFRGVFYGAYAGKNPVRGMVLSGLLFALLHLNWNQISYALPLGILLAFVLEVTGSFLAPMIVHFTINAANTALSWYAAQVMDEVELPSTLMAQALSEFEIGAQAIPFIAYVIYFFLAIASAFAVYGLLCGVAISCRYREWMCDLLRGRAPVLQTVDGVPVKKKLADVWLWIGVTIALVYTCL